MDAGSAQTQDGRDDAVRGEGGLDTDAASGDGSGATRQAKRRRGNDFPMSMMTVICESMDTRNDQSLRLMQQQMDLERARMQQEDQRLQEEMAWRREEAERRRMEDALRREDANRRDLQQQQLSQMMLELVKKALEGPK